MNSYIHFDYFFFILIKLITDHSSQFTVHSLLFTVHCPQLYDSCLLIAFLLRASGFLIHILMQISVVIFKFHIVFFVIGKGIF